MTENASARLKKLTEAQMRARADLKYAAQAEGEDWSERERKVKPTPLLLGMGGLLGAGKDAAADYLVEHHGFVKLGMSDPLNDALLALNPYIVRYFLHEYQDFPELPSPEGDDETNGMVLHYKYIHDTVGYTRAKQLSEVRRLLQALGTEVGRNMISDSVWTDIASRRIQELRAAGTPVVITGMRFKNELALITSLGGTLVWVDRPDNPNVNPQANHASENSVGAADFDTVLSNEGTLDDLYKATERLLN